MKGGICHAIDWCGRQIMNAQMIMIRKRILSDILGCKQLLWMGNVAKITS